MVQGGELQEQAYDVLPGIKLSLTREISIWGSGCFADWKIEYPGDCRLVDPRVLLQMTAMAMKEIITEHLYKHKNRLKFMSMYVVFEHAADPAVVLTTSPLYCMPCYGSR